jgi:hypothetical protein
VVARHGTDTEIAAKELRAEVRRQWIVSLGHRDKGALLRNYLSDRSRRAAAGTLSNERRLSDPRYRHGDLKVPR